MSIQQNNFYNWTNFEYQYQYVIKCYKIDHGNWMYSSYLKRSYEKSLIISNIPLLINSY